jgi:hypothetical protein
MQMKPLLLTGCWLFLLASLVGCETKEMSFETVAEAREAGLYVRGWAPDVLPDGAGPIEEAHDLDTNARCLAATMPSESLATVRAALEAEGFVALSTAADRQPEAFCPFAAAGLAETRLLHRDRGDLGMEYAALGAAGTFYYWSAGAASQ